MWERWQDTLMIVKPETVLAWQRKGFRLFWTWRVRHGKPGRPRVPQEVRDLIRMISRNNPRWGAPRIHGELIKLGIQITEPTVAKYMVRHRKPPSQTWRTFLETHVKSMVSVDFFTVPTVRFRILYVFLVLAHLPATHSQLRCDGPCHCGVECSADARSVPVGHGTSLPAARS